MEGTHSVEQFLPPMLTERHEARQDGIVHHFFLSRLERGCHIFQFLVDVRQVLGYIGRDGFVAVLYVVEKNFEIGIIGVEKVLDPRLDIVVVLLLHEMLRLAVQQGFGSVEEARFEIEQRQQAEDFPNKLVPVGLGSMLQKETGLRRHRNKLDGSVLIYKMFCFFHTQLKNRAKVRQNLWICKFYSTFAAQSNVLK